jgi:hypothetical protein
MPGNILFTVFRATLPAGFLFVVLFFCGSAFALPMKPDIRVLLQEAHKPQQRFVPARAGWNGPEERSSVTEPNLTYETLRAERTPAEMRRQFFATALPDWRILAAICGLIAAMRMLKPNKRHSLAPVLSFPSAAPALEEAA